MRMTAAFGPDVVRRTGYRAALIEVAVISNAALAAYSLQQEIGAGDSHEIRAASGVYLLEDRQIWAPRAESSDCKGLAYPPADFAAFGDFGDSVLRTEPIARLLDGVAV